MPHDLIAPRDETAKPLGPLVGNPHLRQKAAGMELRQNPGIDLVGLDPGMGDRLHLHRIGDNHPADEGRKHAHHRHGIAGRLDNDLVSCNQAAAEPFQTGAGHVDPSVVAQPAIFPENHFRKSAVDVHSNHTSHWLPLP